MNSHYVAFIEFGKGLAASRGLPWDILLDDKGLALDGIGWNLTATVGDVSSSTSYQRDFGTDGKTLAILNRERADAGLVPRQPGAISAHWQDLVKAVVAEQLLFKRNTTTYVTQMIARPLRVIATCVDKEPWQLNVDDLRTAARIGTAVQATGKLGDCVIALVKILFDAKHLCDASPLYPSLDMPRFKGRDYRAKHRKSPQELRDDLEARKRGERLPDRRAFWELTRIVMTEKPKTLIDGLRFAAVRTLIMTGMRAGEVALLPTDWKRERTYLDSKGRPAGESGGISTSLMIRHFAEKQQDEESDSRILTESAQPVPEMFRDSLKETLDHVAKITAPLRETLKLQCESGRILPWYAVDAVVPILEVYTRLTGNPFWQKIEREPFIARYRDGFDPAIFSELQEYQHERLRSAYLKLDQSFYQFGHRLKEMMRDGKTALRFRHGDGTQVNLLERIEWNAVHLRVGEVEEHVRLLTPTKVSDTPPLRLAAGQLQPWELLFIQPKRSLAEERNDGICDITRYASVNRPDTTLLGHALGDAPHIPSLFEKYGQTDQDRALKIDPTCFVTFKTLSCSGWVLRTRSSPSASVAAASPRATNTIIEASRRPSSSRDPSGHRDCAR
jgi:hypothetical protein